MKYFFLCLLLMLSVYDAAYADNEPVEWNPPDSMLFKNWGFSPEEIAVIAGEDQIMINGKLNSVMLWTKKDNKPVEYKNARIAYSATILDGSPEMIRQVILNFSGKKPFKMIENLKILKKINNHTMIQYEEQKSPIPFARKPQFIIQLTEFGANSIGSLLHEGDVGAAVMTFNFFKLTEKKTLLTMAAWSDTKSASFSYRIILKAEPAFEQVQTTMLMSAFIQEVKVAIADLSEESIKKCGSNGAVDEKIKTPYFSLRKDLHMQSLLKLLKIGTVQFYHPPQKFNRGGEVVDFPEITTIRQIFAPVNVVKPILSDYSTQKKYHPFFVNYKNSVVKNKDYSIMKYGLHLGSFSLGAKARISEYWVNENIKEYRGEHKSDLEPLASCMEFISIPEDDSTLYVHTFGGVICDDAPFYLKFLRALPSADLILSGGFSLLTADTGADWMNIEIGNKK